MNEKLNELRSTSFGGEKQAKTKKGSKTKKQILKERA
jgi:hypothetical protein